MAAHPPFDIAIIGGGINGAGVARDAAGRGASVILFEAGDYAGCTSSASTKLIHGGLRYLEHYAFGLVREALAEREILWGIAPHLIHPMRFVLPYHRGLRPRWLLRLGLFLYDHIGGRKLLPTTETIHLARHPAGAPLQAQYRHGFVYSDCADDDARLVIANLRDAAAHGAAMLRDAPVTALARENGLWRIRSAKGEFWARSIVNAAGPHVLNITRMAGVASRHAMRQVRGSHIVVRRLFTHDFAYFFQLADGRIFFAIPYQRDFTLIGTTDCDHDDAMGPPVATAAEIDYLCRGINEYFDQQITPQDVVWAFSGVRPLVDDGSGKPESATRGYVFEMDVGADGDAPPMLSVFGGKITSYRHLAGEVMEHLAPHVAALTGAAWTGAAPLPGGDFPVTGFDALVAELARDYSFLDGFDARRIAAAYGTEARCWLGGAQSRADLGQDFGHGLSAAEVDWMVEREWARDVSDILWRRSKLGLRLSAQESARLAEYVAQKTAILGQGDDA